MEIDGLNFDINEFTKRTSQLGGVHQSITNAFYGLDALQTGLPMEEDESHLTHIFFTRPQLNLTLENCVLTKELIKTLTDNRDSVHNYIRTQLDPRLFYSKLNLKSSLTDPYNPFIPILSNTLTKMSGWPDPVLATKESAEGRVKQKTVIVDGTSDIYGTFDLDATFMNIRGMPVTNFMATWLDYMDKVHKGHIQPYLDMLLRREIDYQTRIYVIVTTLEGNNIKMFANTGASFPYVNNIGSFVDYDRSNKTKNTEVSIRFKSIGAEYNNYNSLKDFNMLMGAFNPEIKKMQNGEEHKLFEVPESLYSVFKNRMYPYIDIPNGKLLWFIPEDQFEIKKKETK